MKTSDVQSLLTKFFYKGDHLHFQILLQNEQDTHICGEYADYRAYRTAFAQITQGLREKTNLLNY